MKTYLVGGAVRDALLGIPVKDRDWVVVGARDQQLLDLGYKRVGKDFPVFLHPESNEEYALARTERKTGRGYKGFAFDSSAEVTLEEDLLRRDLTINAIAQSDDGRLIDPYGGQADIENKVLRHVSPAFSEDPLRVLRVARFAARFAHLGFTVAEETLELMQGIVTAGEMEHLIPERVWREIETALSEKSPAVFFQVLRDCHALKTVLPEVDNLFGVPQPEKYHPEIDTGIHTLMCMEQAARLSKDPVVRFATLVHDLGKAVTDKEKWPSHHGHEMLGLALVEKVSTRLKIPNEYAAIGKLVCEHHTKLHRLPELRPATVLKLLEALDAFRRPERMDKFLLACEADSRGRTGFEDRDYPQAQILNAYLKAANNLDIPELLRNNPNKQPADLIAQRRQHLIKNAMSETRL